MQPLSRYLLILALINGVSCSSLISKNVPPPPRVSVCFLEPRDNPFQCRCANPNGSMTWQQCDSFIALSLDDFKAVSDYRETLQGLLEQCNQGGL